MTKPLDELERLLSSTMKYTAVYGEIVDLLAAVREDQERQQAIIDECVTKTQAQADADQYADRRFCDAIELAAGVCDEMATDEQSEANAAIEKGADKTAQERARFAALHRVASAVIRRLAGGKMPHDIERSDQWVCETCQRVITLRCDCLTEARPSPPTDPTEE